MKRKAFRDYLKERGFEQDIIDNHLAFIEKMQDDLGSMTPSKTFHDLDLTLTQTYVNHLIEEQKKYPSEFISDCPIC